MWAIIKYKRKEYGSLVADLKKRLDNKIIFYNPKVKYLKKVSAEQTNNKHCEV